ncbi:MAG: MotA/TolQ/ExbB proton channel family protein [Myxococcales bacterium]|nr:MotA/TolQ/ExbB proton channel family protein [Myxococcales bacterium]
MKRVWSLLLMCGLLLLASSAVFAQEIGDATPGSDAAEILAPAAAAEPNAEGALPGILPERGAGRADVDEGAEVDIDFAEVLGYGGTVGYAILALSIIGLALAAVFFFELRIKALVPAKLASDVREALGRGEARAALDQSRKSPTFLGHILRSGLEALEDGRPEARNVMADAAESWMSGVVRRVEYLNLIATVAPMLGLLGTVTGMVKTFAALSQSTGPVDPVQLSAGIFQALVTTMMGLSVAIPILLLYTVLRNRADHVQATGIAVGEQAVAALPERLSHGGAAPTV